MILQQYAHNVGQNSSVLYFENMPPESCLGTPWGPSYEHICKNIHFWKGRFGWDPWLKRASKTISNGILKIQNAWILANVMSILLWYHIMTLWYVDHMCIILYYTVLYCIIIYSIILYYTYVYCIILYYTIWSYYTPYFTVLYCDTLCYTFCIILYHIIF